MIEIKNLTKLYGAHKAVDDISFSVQEGEVYGLLGPNGAGKTTTMNILTGYTPATSGSVKIAGYDIFDEASMAKSHIGYLPEHPPLYTDMTPHEYLYFLAELRDIDDTDAAVEKAEQTAGIEEVKHRLIANLSKGYKQRVGLAGAILGGPDVLILDEPTSGLDPKQIIEIRSLIKSLSKGHTVLLSSHILSEVSAVCDKVLIINNGRLVAFDTPDKLSESVAQGHIIKMTLQAAEQDVKNALDNIDDITLDFEECDEQGCVVALITCGEQGDLRYTIGSALADAKVPVLSMQSQTKSLEDVFLQLTSDDFDGGKNSDDDLHGGDDNSADGDTLSPDENAATPDSEPALNEGNCVPKADRESDKEGASDSGKKTTKRKRKDNE